jgi:hypothetical protein
MAPLGSETTPVTPEFDCPKANAESANIMQTKKNDLMIYSLRLILLRVQKVEHRKRCRNDTEPLLLDI